LIEALHPPVKRLVDGQPRFTLPGATIAVRLAVGFTLGAQGVDPMTLASGGCGSSVTNEEFVPHYQPNVELKPGEILGRGSAGSLAIQYRGCNRQGFSIRSSEGIV
jgi:hypothetical protein